MKNFRKSIFKLFLFSLIIFSLIIGAKAIFVNNYTEWKIQVPKNTEKTPYYFIGSSRVQHAINPTLLQEKFLEKNFINLGVGGMTFNYSEQVALELMKSKNKKIIFIELSRVQAASPVHFQYLLNYKSLGKAFLRSLESWSFEKKDKFISDLDLFIFNFFSTRRELALLLTPQLFNSYQGYRESALIYLGDEQIFIEKDFQSNKKEKKVYLNIISNLLRKSEETNTKIIFFLPPITFGSLAEKEEVVAFFEKIPTDNKFIYEEVFIEEITQKKYLFDSNHLNKYGAEKYTRHLISFIEREKL